MDQLTVLRTSYIVGGKHETYKAALYRNRDELNFEESMPADGDVDKLPNG